MCPISFSRFLDTILGIYAPAHAPRTTRKMARVLGLVRAMGVQNTAELTTELAARFVARRAETVNPNTIRGDLSYLSAACSFAVEEGWLDHPPRFNRVRPRPLKSSATKVHSITEVAAVLDLLRSRSETWKGGRVYALAATVAYTGLRRDEALTLQVEDVNLAASLLTISDRLQRKTEASAAIVPIPPELVDILRIWLPLCGCDWIFPGVRRQGPWTGGKCGERACDLIREAGRECGVAGCTLHSLRHSFATWARRRWGLSAMELQQILRHTSPRTQAWYLHPDPDPQQTALVISVRHVSYRSTEHV
jgi:integrase